MIFFRGGLGRLVPAYFVLLIVATIGAYVISPPDILIKYGETLQAQAVYLQNVALLAQGDYFTQAIEKPLLHTWSLGVEEQFYLLFPLLIFIYRKTPRFWPVIVSFIGLSSLLLGLEVANISPRAAFYLLPFRIWEFVAGIVAASVYRRRLVTLPSSSVLLQIFCFGALLLIASSVWAFNETASSPGAQALLALLGAFVLCVFQDGVGPALSGIASNRIIQHFGRISYSWYLWHWPPVSLYAIWAGHRPGPGAGVAILVIGYICAVASFYFVEKPGLQTLIFKRGRNVSFLLSSFLLFCALAGTWLINSRGAINRYPKEARPYFAAQYDKPSDERCPIPERLRLIGRSICNRNGLFGEGGLLIIGDSHFEYEFHRR